LKNLFNFACSVLASQMNSRHHVYQSQMKEETLTTSRRIMKMKRIQQIVMRTILTVTQLIAETDSSNCDGDDAEHEDNQNRLLTLAAELNPQKIENAHGSQQTKQTVNRCGTPHTTRKSKHFIASINLNYLT